MGNISNLFRIDLLPIRQVISSVDQETEKQTSVPSASACAYTSF
jgi:hypothetical protein